MDELTVSALLSHNVRVLNSNCSLIKFVRSAALSIHRNINWGRLSDDHAGLQHLNLMSKLKVNKKKKRKSLSGPQSISLQRDLADIHGFKVASVFHLAGRRPIHTLYVLGLNWTVQAVLLGSYQMISRSFGTQWYLTQWCASNLAAKFKGHAYSVQHASASVNKARSASKTVSLVWCKRTRLTCTSKWHQPHLTSEVEHRPRVRLYHPPSVPYLPKTPCTE